VSDPEHLLPVARAAAEAAGVVLRRAASGSRPRVRWKAPGDPVSDADLAADRAIREELGPTGLPVVSEEGAEDSAAGRHWLVDPLDGTRSFLAGSPAYGVHVALIEEGLPILGVVHQPALGLTWSGGSGLPSLRDDGHRTRVLQVCAADRGPLRVTLSRSHRGPELSRLLERLGGHVRVWAKGAGLKAMAVAEGQVQLYLAPPGRLATWDLAAPEAILRGAGGRVTGLDGLPIAYGLRRALLEEGCAAGEPLAHARLLAGGAGPGAP
jgi:3'(2'), 5'-bisphosphate nucleotidase